MYIHIRVCYQYLNPNLSTLILNPIFCVAHVVVPQAEQSADRGYDAKVLAVCLHMHMAMCCLYIHMHTHNIQIEATMQSTSQCVYTCTCVYSTLVNTCFAL